MARELSHFNPYLYRVMRLLGWHRDEMADAVSEARTAVLFSPPHDAFPTLNNLHELLI